MNNDERKVLFRKGVFTNNPLLFEMVGVCPVVAIATSVATACTVAVITALELIIIEEFACACLKNVKRYFRVLIYAVLGFLINLPLFFLFGKVMPDITGKIGIFLPLLAVSSVIALHCETFAVKNTAKDTFFDALSTSIGYAAVVLLIGAAREILGNGTLFGKTIGLPYQCEAFLMPFGGFLALGFIAAFIKGAAGKKYGDEINSCGLDTSQIRALHIRRLKQLIDENDDDDDSSPVPVSTKREKKKKESAEKPKKIRTAPKKQEKPVMKDEKPAVLTEKEQEKTPSEKTAGYQPFADVLASLDEYKASKSEADTEKKDGGEENDK